MLSSKAERILSRYRPIAPKPLPFLPSGSFATTDPSSTCASVDSFASSAKCKKSRKRRADDSASAKGIKVPKSMGSGFSNTGGASSLTQGASDGTVPLEDLRSASQISHGSMALGKDEYGKMPIGTTRDAGVKPGDVRFAGYGGIGASLYVSDVGNMMLPQKGAYVLTDVYMQQHQQHAFSLLRQNLSSGDNYNSGGLAEKDVGLMEREAATMPMERSALASMSDAVGGKVVGYVGGGFTEMIRGITHLPTTADVQSLMQARVSPSAATELTTLSLLPNVPSRMSLPGKVGIRDGSPSAQPPTHGVTDAAESPWHHQASLKLDPPVKAVSPSAQPPIHGLTHVTEHSWHSSRFQPSVKVAIRDVPASSQSHMHGQPSHQVTHVAEPPWNQQISSRIDSSAKSVIGDASPPARHLIPDTGHAMEPPWHQQISEPTTSHASRSLGMPHMGMQFASGVSLFSLSPKKPTNGPVMSSMNLPSTGMAASSVMADGQDIDEVSLEQVYGGSTDPVLLLDDSNQVLWFNKPYDKAMKSASERFSGKTKPTGPYIDPLGHPTPLCSFVLNVHGKPSKATLWGFLKKLVIQESELPLRQGSSGPPSQLQQCVGEASHMELNGRMGSRICASNSRLTTVTLESVTEIHIDAPAIPECVEAAEARLEAGSEPGFIMDCSNRVRWVNAALKQMLGHSNFERTNKCHGGGDVAMSSSMEVPTFVVFCAEKIPRAAWAFSCRVNLEWMKGSKRRSMTVPCDVSRLTCASRSSEVSWVWQFDMRVSLCLNAPS